MADANLIIAVARGTAQPLIAGAVANARASVQQLVATNQLADRRDIALMSAANALQTPNNVVDIFV